MAKLITKFKYLKPNGRVSIGGYAKYIATREGVEKIDDSQKLAHATIKQKDIIDKILRDFPDSKDMLEYEDYLASKTVGTAIEFVTRALEENAHEIMSGRTYADYIATRPRAERFGSHGLFTDDGIQVQLSKVSEELNLHGGNVWTSIISLRREDAERLGFNTGERWRDMLRTQTQVLSDNLKIPMGNLCWFAAFHNESHHPHVHLIAYSKVENEGYLTKQGVANLRSSFAKDIFAQDLQSTYEKQTEHRNDLRLQSREVVAGIVSQINSSSFDNPAVEELLIKLSEHLSKTSGKKVYGYLKADVKSIIDSIVDELSKDKNIATLYDLWYERRDEILRTYTEAIPDRIPLSQNKEFKSIKNVVIQEAMNIITGRMADDDTIIEDIPEPEPRDTESESIEPPPPMTEYTLLKRKAESGNKWAQYGFGKLLMDRENKQYNPQEAVKWLIESAKQGYTVAQYKLGKMFLHGEYVSKNIDYALRWLEQAVKQNNQYAEYLLGKAFLKGVDFEQDVSRAVDLLQKSAKQGNRYATYTFGKTLLDGDIISQDIHSAIELLTHSADKGFAPAEYILGKLLYRGEIITQDISKAIYYLKQAAEKENPLAAYLAGKILLTEDSYKDINKAIRFLSLSAKSGNPYAEYQLGKLYFYGKEVDQDYEKAIAYLTASAENGNQHAEQLLHSIKNNRHWSVALGSFRLLQHLGRMIQNRIDDERKGKIGLIDKKLKQQIDEKKQAHGVRQ